MEQTTTTTLTTTTTKQRKNCNIGVVGRIVGFSAGVSHYLEFF